MRHCFLSVVFVLLSLVSAARADRLLHALDAARSDGNISRSHELGLRARALVARHTLPAPYDTIPPSPPVKSLTPYTAELDRNISLFSAADLQAVSSLFARPVLPLRNETEHFVIHYALTGADSVDAAFVDSAARIFEYCHDRIITDRGYRAPPADDRFDPKYDVYLVDVPTAYDQTFLGVTRRDVYRQQTVSYIEMDNGFTDSIYSIHGVEALKVVAAHELFHAVQFAYSDFPAAATGGDYIWWMELSSTWMEDEIYDDINHYIWYLYPRYMYPNYSLLTYNGWYEYGNSPFAKMLERVYGPGVVKGVWERLGGNSLLLPLQAVGDELQQLGTDWETEFSRFTLWNFFTKSFSDSVNYFRECARYPYAMVNMEFNSHNAEQVPEFDGPDSIPLLPEYLGANYLTITHCAGMDSLHFEFEDRGGSDWRLNVLLANRDITVTVDTLYRKSASVWAYDFVNAGYTDLYFAVSRVGADGTGEYGYRYRAHRAVSGFRSADTEAVRSGLSVFPQPAVAYADIRLPEACAEDVAIVALGGKTVSAGMRMMDRFTVRVDVTVLAPGRYWALYGGAAVPFTVVK